MLGLLIAMLDRPASLEKELREMGARHANYGVKDEHYEFVGRALLDMLANVCGAAFTPDVRAAWTELYDSVQSAMRRGAAAGTAAA
jgi:methyl-accepting chemotaxis protein